MSDAFRELGRRLRPRKLSFEPCLPRPAKVPPVGADWIHEIKHDGFRIVARKDATGVRLDTRKRRSGYRCYSEKCPVPPEPGAK
jgi:ATP-dependent DNA ligase